MTTIRIQTGVRFETDRGLGEYDPDIEREIPIVEVVIGGRSFTAECETPERARELVVRTAQDLGLDLPCACEGCVSSSLPCRCHGSAEVLIAHKPTARMWCSECQCTTVHAGGCDKTGEVAQRKPTLEQRRAAHGMPPIPAEQRAANLESHLDSLERRFHARAAELEPLNKTLPIATDPTAGSYVQVPGVYDDLILTQLARDNARRVMCLLPQLEGGVAEVPFDPRVRHVPIEVTPQNVGIARPFHERAATAVDAFMLAHAQPVCTTCGGSGTFHYTEPCDDCPKTEDTEPPCPACTARGKCFDRCPNAGNERPYVGPNTRTCEDH